MPKGMFINASQPPNPFLNNNLSEDEVFLGLQDAKLPWPAQALRSLARAFKTDPELAKYLKKDSALLYCLSKESGVSALLETRPEDIVGTIKQRYAQDSFRAEAPPGVSLLPPQEVAKAPSDAPLVPAHEKQTIIG